jgi:hypothetical protein
VGKHECDIEVIEVEHLNFENVKNSLKNGKSVFMTTIPRLN